MLNLVKNSKQNAKIELYSDAKQNDKINSLQTIGGEAIAHKTPKSAEKGTAQLLRPNHNRLYSTNSFLNTAPKFNLSPDYQHISSKFKNTSVAVEKLRK